MDLSRATTYEVQTNIIVLTMYRRICLVYSYVQSTDQYYSTDYVQTDMSGIPTQSKHKKLFALTAPIDVGKIQLGK